MNDKDTKLIWEAVTDIDVDDKTHHDRVADRHDEEEAHNNLRSLLSRLNDWIDDKLANVNDLTASEVATYTDAVRQATEDLEPLIPGEPELDPVESEPEEDLYPGGEEQFGRDMADMSNPLPPGPDGPWPTF